MASKPVNTDPVDPLVLETLRTRALEMQCRWAAYENHDLGHYDIGQHQFLAIGPTCTFQEPPSRAPDSLGRGFGWRYVHVGWVNLETGLIEPEPAG